MKLCGAIQNDKINLQELTMELSKNNFSLITIDESEEDYWWLNANRIVNLSITCLVLIMTSYNFYKIPALAMFTL